MLVGIDFEAARIIKAWWEIKGAAPENEGVVVGQDLARTLSLAPGLSVRVNETMHPVTGVLERTGSQDDGLIFMSLRNAQKILNKNGKLSMVEIAALCASCPLEEMVKQISEVLPNADVMPIMQAVKGRMETLGYFRKFAYTTSGVILFVGGLMVMVTMISSIRERTSEIGIFRAMGFRRSHIVKIVFLEATIMAGFSGVIGYFTGYGIAKWILPAVVGIRDLPVAFDFHLTVNAVLLAVTLGLLSAVYPSLIAAKLDPNESLRAL